MRRFLVLLIPLLLACVAVPASASKEGALAWAEFVISSPGIGSSGPVKVYGTQSSAGIEQLHVEAFGRKFAASESVAKALQGFVLNGMQLTYEAGYPETGGQTLHLTFLRGFTSGTAERRQLELSERDGILLQSGYRH
jgi:hypothetical protein